MKIICPSPDSKDFADLPMEVRDDVRAWIWAFESHPVSKPIVEWFNRVAQVLNVKASTVKNKYYAIKKNPDWRVLVDNRKGSKPTTECRTKSKSFQQFFKKLCEDNQRSTEAAIRQLKRMWRAKEPIPGFTDFPGWPAMPKGFSARNLRRCAPSKLELSAMRFGINTAAKHLPQIYSTRVGLWPGAFYQFDDVWHDNYVRIGNSVTRVLELGALDVLSGCRFAFGAKPRMTKADGSGMENLKEKEMRLFLARVLYQHGWNPNQGTTLVIENGTATVRDDVERMLYDATGGKLQISRSGLQGKQQAVLNMWGGRNGGNPRHKASLESLHNLIHNELGNLIGQTGHDRNEPEMTHGLVEYQRKLLAKVSTLDEARQDLLKHPVLDFHSQFYPLLVDFYDTLINGREDHNLEGWQQLGFTTNEYTTMPGSEQWLTLDMLPEASRAIISAAAKQDPDTWSRTRKLSPLEVWNQGKTQLQPISPYLVCDILGKDFAEERKVKGSYIEFTDSNISPEPLLYQSRIITPEGRQVELKSGEKYLTFSNPYDPAQLFICDAHYRCLGIAPQIERVSPANVEALQAQYGKRAERKADILEDLRMRHKGSANDVQALREHNRRVLENEPVTETDRRIAGGKKASNTRRRNRVNENAQEQLTDQALDAWSKVESSSSEDANEDSTDHGDDTTKSNYNPFI